MAGIDRISQQDGRVVKAPSFTRRKDYIYAGYAEVRILLPKKFIGWADGEVKTRPVVTMAGIDQIKGAA